MSKIVRITQSAYEKLNALEADMKSSKQDIIEQALEKLSRERFLNKVNQAYGNLRNNTKAWQEELNERKEWQNAEDSIED